MRQEMFFFRAEIKRKIFIGRMLSGAPAARVIESWLAGETIRFGRCVDSARRNDFFCENFQDFRICFFFQKLNKEKEGFFFVCDNFAF